MTAASSSQSEYRPTTEAVRSERAGTALAVLIVTAALANPLAFTGIYSVLPAISQHFSSVPHAETLVRALVTVVAVAVVVGAPMAGFMVERFGERRVLLTAISVFAVAGLSGLLIDNLWLFLAFRALLGLSDAFIGTLIIAIIAERLTPACRNRWLGWYTLASTVGALVFISLSGVLGQFGWRYVFLIYLVALPVWLSAFMTVKDGPRRFQGSRPKSAGSAFYFPVVLVAMGIAAGAIENTTHIYLPFHLAQIGESSPSKISQALLPIAIGGSLSAFLYGRVRSKLTVGTTFAVSFLFSGLALIWLGFSTSYSEILLAGTFLGLAVGVLAPNIHAYGAVFGDPALQARNIGFARGAFFAGAPAAQIMLEPVSQRAGAGMAVVTLGISAFALMTWSLLNRQRMVG